MTLGQAARKAVVATASDFAAKASGHKDFSYLLPSPTVRLSTVNEIVAGLEKGAREYHCRIIVETQRDR